MKLLVNRKNFSNRRTTTFKNQIANNLSFQDILDSLNGNKAVNWDCLHLNSLKKLITKERLSEVNKMKINQITDFINISFNSGKLLERY